MQSSKTVWTFVWDEAWLYSHQKLKEIHPNLIINKALFVAFIERDIIRLLKIITRQFIFWIQEGIKDHLGVFKFCTGQLGKGSHVILILVLSIHIVKNLIIFYEYFVKNSIKVYFPGRFRKCRGLLMRKHFRFWATLFSRGLHHFSAGEHQWVENILHGVQTCFDATSHFRQCWKVNIEVM